MPTQSPRSSARVASAVAALAALTALPACARQAVTPSGVAADAVAEHVAAGALADGASAYNPSPAPDGRTLVFARSEPGFRHPAIYVTRLRRGRWTRPARVPFADPRWGDTDPTLTIDGRTLYFASNRPAPGRDSSRRDLDLWRVRRTADAGGERWGVPEHLGTPVNTRGQELGPTWRDGVLYFASARRGGAGRLDLYAAREIDGRFEAAAPFGGAVNTAASEGDPELSPDGRVLVFWSERPGGRGSADLYASRRDSAGGWSAPVPLRGTANSAWFDFTPAFSPDGRWLYFASERPSATSGAPRAPRAPGEAADGEGAADVWRIRVTAAIP